MKPSQTSGTSVWSTGDPQPQRSRLHHKGHTAQTPLELSGSSVRPVGTRADSPGCTCGWPGPAPQSPSLGMRPPETSRVPLGDHDPWGVGTCWPFPRQGLVVRVVWSLRSTGREPHNWKPVCMCACVHMPAVHVPRGYGSHLTSRNGHRVRSPTSITRCWERSVFGEDRFGRSG